MRLLQLCAIIFRHQVNEMNEKLSFKMGVIFTSSVYLGENCRDILENICLKVLVLNCNQYEHTINILLPLTLIGQGLTDIRIDQHIWGENLSWCFFSSFLIILNRYVYGIHGKNICP